MTTKDLIEWLKASEKAPPSKRGPGGYGSAAMKFRKARKLIEKLSRQAQPHPQIDRTF